MNYLLRNRLTKLVISQTDIDAALAHLNSLPGTITANMPSTWAQEQFLKWLLESMPATTAVGDCFSVATGVYAHIVSVGFDYLSPPKDDRLQIILSIRKCNTDLSALVCLAGN